MAERNETFGVAVIGCGTVGGATATILTRDQDVLQERIKRPIELKYIVDVDFTHAEELELDKSLYCTDLDKALDDPSVHLVVELVGGTTLAKEFIIKALNAGKHVVTANKALLAHHGVELYELARKNNVSIAFEASCAGGIPIVRALCSGLIANRIDALYGIVNGTCNYVLTAMADEGKSYADTLKQAQKDGLAEADPTLDVAGIDSAHKLAILSALAFGKKVDFDEIPVQGIDKLMLCDVEYGQELGYTVKLLAIAQTKKDGVSLRVRPAFISKDHPLAWVSGPFNAVSVYSHATGHTMYYGRGAGGMPTASAVVADIVEVGLGIVQKQFNGLNVWPDLNEPANQLPVEAIDSRYYIRLMAMDHPGVMARISEVLGRNNIGITAVLQHEPEDFEDKRNEIVPVVITTYYANEGAMRKARAELDELDVIRPRSVCLPIVDEHPERFF